MKRPTQIALGVFLSLLALTQFLTYQRYRLAQARETEAVLHELGMVGDGLKELLSHSLAATNTLAFVIENYGVPEDFNSVAAGILKSNRHIDALELTRKGVITHIYPLPGNEKALGLDVLTDSLTRAEALKAIEKGELFFAGPLPLRQGGIGVVGRLPIYLDGEFFGFSAVVIRLNTLFRSLGISEQPPGKFVYQLSKVNPLTNKEEFFLPGSSRSNFEASAFIDVPDGAWKLSVGLAQSALLRYDIIAFSLMGVVLSIVSGLYAYRWAREPEKLARLVEERTAQLLASEKRYRIMLARISDAFISFDKDFRYTYANKRARELFGFRPSEIIGQNIWHLYPSMKETGLFTALSEAMEQQHYVSYEFYFPERGRWLENHIYPSKDGLSIFLRDVTAIKEATARLEASERYFRALIENSADAVVLINKEGKVTYQSPSTERIIGYNLVEAQTLDGLSLIHPEDRENAAEVFSQVLGQPGKTCAVRHRLQHGNGHYVWIEGTYVNLLHDPDVQAIIHNYHDVTERLAAEEAIANEKFLSDSIINSLPGIFYLYNEKRNFIRWNKNFEEVSGYSAAEIARMQPLDFFDGDEKKLLDEKIEAVFRKGEDEVEASFLSKSGVKTPHFFTGKRVFVSGESYLMGMGIDITRRLAAEAMAMTGLKEKETVLNRISDGVVSLDRQGCYQFLNDAALATHPGGRENTLGKPLLEVHPELEGGVFWKMCREAMDTQQVMETEAYYKPMDRWFSAKVYPSENGLTIFYRDVSEKKTAEQEMLRLIDVLRAKNNDLRQFSYIVSHNLRAPLANILGLISILGDDPDEDREYLRLIGDEANRLDQVVKDMNAVVDIRKTGVEQHQRVWFEHQFRRIEEELSSYINASGAQLICDFSAAPEIDSLPGYVLSIMYQLVENAIKYRRKDEPARIKLETSKAEGFVCLSVTDNGVGIDLQRQKNKVFGLYKRFHSDASIPGRGVGLNMVKTRAEFLGGRVEVQSEINKGSVFKVYLPEEYGAVGEG